MSPEQATPAQMKAGRHEGTVGFLVRERKGFRVQDVSARRRLLSSGQEVESSGNGALAGLHCALNGQAWQRVPSLQPCWVDLA